MVFILKKNAPQEKIDQFRQYWESKGFSTIWAPGTDHNAICLIGNTAAIDMDATVHTSDILSMAGVSPNNTKSQAARFTQRTPRFV